MAAKISTEAKMIAKEIKAHDPVGSPLWSKKQAVVKRFELVGMFFSNYEATTYSGAWAAKTGRMDVDVASKILDMPLNAFVQRVLDIHAHFSEASNSDRANAWMAI